MDNQNKSKVKESGKLSRNVLNIIRTTMRNNIELTHIADNKANVLLSLNALMLTFLVPIVVANFGFIETMRLGVSIGLLVTTCLITIYLSALALTPTDFKKLEKERGGDRFSSPFFYGNYHKLSPEEFEERIGIALNSDAAVKKHIVQDLYYIGARLGQKMGLIRLAFHLFMTGLIVSVLVAAFTMLIIN